jgi:hypothetical protein
VIFASRADAPSTTPLLRARSARRGDGGVAVATPRRRGRPHSVHRIRNRDRRVRCHFRATGRRAWVRPPCRYLRIAVPLACPSTPFVPTTCRWTHRAETREQGAISSDCSASVHPDRPRGPVSGLVTARKSSTKRARSNSPVCAVALPWPQRHPAARMLLSSVADRSVRQKPTCRLQMGASRRLRKVEDGRQPKAQARKGSPAARRHAADQSSQRWDPDGAAASTSCPPAAIASMRWPNSSPARGTFPRRAAAAGMASRPPIQWPSRDTRYGYGVAVCHRLSTTPTSRVFAVKFARRGGGAARAQASAPW